MKIIIILIFLILSFLSNADDLNSINSNLLLKCDPTYSEVGEYDLDSFGYTVASTGICQFDEYKIEFFKNLKSASAHLCANQPYCGAKASWKGASWDIDTIVRDSNGTILFENIFDDYEGHHGEAFILDPSSFNIPYLVIKTIDGRNSYLHLFSVKPNFHKVLSIGPLSYLYKGIYTNDLKQIFIDIGVTTLPPDHPSMANVVYYPITMKLVDNHFVTAVEQMKIDLKIYTEDDIKEVYDLAKQINLLISKYIFNPGNESTDHPRRHAIFMMGDIHQLGFMSIFMSLVRNGKIDLAWEFFDLAIPSSYDLNQKFNNPIYKTKKMMRETISNWLTNRKYWDEIKQLNSEESHLDL